MNDFDLEFEKQFETLESLARELDKFKVEQESVVDRLFKGKRPLNKVRRREKDVLKPKVKFEVPRAKQIVVMDFVGPRKTPRLILPGGSRSLNKLSYDDNFLFFSQAAASIPQNITSLVILLPKQFLPPEDFLESIKEKCFLATQKLEEVVTIPKSFFLAAGTLDPESGGGVIDKSPNDSYVAFYVYRGFILQRSFYSFGTKETDTSISKMVSGLAEVPGGEESEPALILTQTEKDSATKKIPLESAPENEMLRMAAEKYEEIGWSRRT